eukprot:51459-Amphidinium_carterae.1
MCILASLPAIHPTETVLRASFTTFLELAARNQPNPSYPDHALLAMGGLFSNALCDMCKVHAKQPPAPNLAQPQGLTRDNTDNKLH